MSQIRRLGVLALALPLALFSQEPSVFGNSPIQEQEMRFEPLKPTPAQPPVRRVPKNTTEEIADIKSELFSLQSAVKNLEESQEGLRSVFEGQNRRLQTLSSPSSAEAKSEWVSRVELEKALGEMTTTLNGNLALYDENFKNIKDSVKALGELIEKIHQNSKEEVESLRLELDEIRQAAGLKPKAKPKKQESSAPTKDEKAKPAPKNQGESTPAKSAQAGDSNDDFAKKDGFTLYKEAGELLEKGKLAEAKKRLEWTAKNRYKPASSHYLLGEIAFKEKRYKDAIYYYKESATLYDKASYMPTLLLHSAQSFTKIGEKENATRFLESLIALYPESKEAAQAQKLLSR